jgi:cell division transport system permease protein
MSHKEKINRRKFNPSAIFSIVGVSLVLLLLGITGWLFMNLKQLGDTYKEEIRISAYLRTANKDTIAALQQYIAKQPYAKDVQFIDKEAAKAIWNKDNNEDWNKIIDYNPLPESIDFFVKAAYVKEDSLQKISSDLTAKYGFQISDLSYPKILVNNMDEKTTKLGLVFLAIAIVLCLIVIVSIDNTIRLTMYSNRFLIKTMQMVGATQGFIVKPLDTRAIVNGLISALIAIVVLFGISQGAESLLFFGYTLSGQLISVPPLKPIHDPIMTIILIGGIIIIGVCISLFSTHRSVIKYLKTRLDDLY